MILNISLYFALTREILFLPLEHKIHMFSPPCNILYIQYICSKYKEIFNTINLYPVMSMLKLKINVKLPQLLCIVVSAAQTRLAYLTIFRIFPSTFRRFPKILQNLSEGRTNVAEHFPKISEDCRRLSRKTRRCFDHTTTNLSTI